MTWTCWYTTSTIASHPCQGPLDRWSIPFYLDLVTNSRLKLFLGILPHIYGFSCPFNCIKCQAALPASSLRAPPQHLLCAEVLTHHLLDVPTRHGLHTRTYCGEPWLQIHDRPAFLLHLWLLSDEDASAFTIWCRLRLDGWLNIRHGNPLCVGPIGHHACSSWLLLWLYVFDGPFLLSNGRPVERIHAQITAFGSQAAASNIDLADGVETGSPTRSQSNRVPPELRLVEFIHWLHCLKSCQEPTSGFYWVHPPGPISLDSTSLNLRNIDFL